MAADAAHRWYHDIQFLAAVPMPVDYVDALGTTVNGMWASPSADPAQVGAAHKEGRRVLFSVPMIALTPPVWHALETAPLMDEVCLDINGRAAHVDWYYWEAEPVYAACIFSDAFRAYLRRRCESGIAADADVVNLDEINTSVGLMSRAPLAPGFCHRCLERFRSVVGEAKPEFLLDDDTLRDRLKSDDQAYAEYRSCLEDEAFSTVGAFIDEIRGIAAEHNADFAITANLAYLGNHVGVHGRLWGASWGELLDFAMLENAYQISPGERSPHLLLPRGTFAPWYRLGAAVTGAPVWICPSILVPQQLDRERRNVYYLLMFLEAYAHGGRWGYFWWPGVDDVTRRAFTVPASLRRYTDFIRDNRRHFEDPVARNRLAVLYLESCVLRRPEWHFEFIALAQALGEAGFQYDVVFSGDGNLASDEFSGDTLAAYDALLVPDLSGATAAQREAIAGYAAEREERLIEFGDLAAPTDLGLSVLARLWSEHRRIDRDLVLARVPSIVGGRITCSHPLVRVVRRESDRWTALHILNHDYRSESDSVAASGPFSIELDWDRSRPLRSATIRTLSGDAALPVTVWDGALRLAVDNIEEYALVVLE